MRSVSLIVILVLLVGVLAYLLGRKSGNVTIQNIVNNEVIVKQIAEFSSLEVRGNASIKSSNLAQDGSFTDRMRKLFMENTITINVPYVAKYGVNLEAQKIRISESKKEVTVYLPAPQLLSYELRLDRSNFTSSQGWLNSQSHEDFQRVERNLYTATRSSMENNSIHLQNAKQKIVMVLHQYYLPTGYKVDVKFAGGDSNLKEGLR